MDAAPILLIVYHSQTGCTEKLAAAIECGAAKVPAVAVMRLPASSVTAEHITDCRGLVVCSPEYFGYMAGAIKDVFDRTYETTHERTIGKSYTIVICAGNDGTGALNSIERIILGYRMKKVQEPLVHRGPITPQILDRCVELGEALAAGIELGIY
jgi:multimeric flavodoxin WrbA